MLCKTRMCLEKAGRGKRFNEVPIADGSSHSRDIQLFHDCDLPVCCFYQVLRLRHSKNERCDEERT